MDNKKNIVTIGGGKGHTALLAGFAALNFRPTAIVNMMDNGGSSGTLMHEYDILAPGDIRRCLVALSQYPEIDELWNYRFDRGSFQNHTVGNIILTAAMLQTSSLQKAIDNVAQFCALGGTVLAVTEERAQLVATLENGEEIFGETNIDIPKHDAALHIKTLRLEPAPRLAPRVAETLQYADLIILAPGDLYSSILPNLLVVGMQEALQKSHGKIVAIINRSTKRGETHGFSTKDFYDVYERALGTTLLHALLIDDGSVALPKTSEGVSHDPALFKNTTVQLLCKDIGDINNPAYIDGAKVAAVIASM